MKATVAMQGGSAASLLQIVRDRLIRLDARGPDGLPDGKAPSKRSSLDDAQRGALAEMVERGPIPAIHRMVRWQLIDPVHSSTTSSRC
ncbi:hypothetical protein [Novosphingobium panipatense]|nr:hypothetical protein [Novosphingobium panipatense]